MAKCAFGLVGAVPEIGSRMFAASDTAVTSEDNGQYVGRFLRMHGELAVLSVQMPTICYNGESLRVTTEPPNYVPREDDDEG